MPQSSGRRAPPREGLLARMVRAVSRRLWSAEIEDLPRKRRGPMRIARIAYLTGRGFTADDCPLRAAALTYITVLSLVPMLAFSFSVLKGFGFYDRFIQTTVNPFVEKTFGAFDPATGASAGVQGSVQMREAIDHVLRFVERTDVASLGIVGLVILIYTVIRLLSAIERALNEIWRAKRSRRPVRKVADYLAIVIITPIFLLAGTVTTTAAQDTTVVSFLRESLHLGPFIKLALGLAPVAAMWLGFTFVFMALPNARTALSSAAVGGFVAAVLWQITLVLHLKFQIGIAGYNAIYASFAAVPIFLVWVNISWIVVLLGAEVCAAHRGEPTYASIPHSRATDQAFKERLAVRVLTRIGPSFLEGLPPWTPDRLATSLRVPTRDLDSVLLPLVEAGLLVVTGPDSDPAFVPARDLATIRLKEVLDALRGEHALAEIVPRSARDEPGDRLLDALAEELETSRHNVTVKDLSESALRSQSQTAASIGVAGLDLDADGDEASLQARV